MSKVFGQELRRLRGLSGLTMRDLAEEIGCSIVYISDIERSRRNPPAPSDIRKLVVKLGFPEVFPEMLRLAFEARRSIEFKLDDSSSPAEINLLLAFKRRIDQGNLAPGIAERIREMLDDDDEQKL